MQQITFYSYGYHVKSLSCDLYFNVADMGATYGGCNDKIVSNF